MEQASVDGVVGLTGSHGHRGGVARAVDVAVECGVAALALGRDAEARGHHLHRVGAGSHVKSVAAGTVGHGGGDDIAGGVFEVDGHTGNAGLAGTLHAVGVLVFEHEVTDVRLGHHHRHQAGIDREVGLTRRQRDAVGLAGDRVGVTVNGVGGVAIGVLGRQRVAAWGHELNQVGARHQVGEQVIAIDVGDLRAFGVAGGVQQHHSHARQACFSGVLDAIAVEVNPDSVTQAGVLVEARVDCGVVLACVEHHHVRHRAVAVGARTGVAVDLAGAGSIEAGRLAHHHLVVQARGQPHEGIAAVGVGDTGGDHLIRAGEEAVTVHVSHQLHRDTRDARLTGILHAVGVEVVPDEVTQLGGLGLDDQRLLVHAGGVDRVKNHAERLTSIRHETVIGQRQIHQLGDFGRVLRTHERGDGVGAHQAPDGTLHFAVGISRSRAGIEIQQPVDIVQIGRIAMELQAGLVGKGTQLIGGINVGGIAANHVDTDGAVQTPGVIDRAGVRRCCGARC